MKSKLKLLKTLEFLMDTDEDHPLTAVQIGNKLKLYDIEAERKSICRDINILRDYGGYDIILSPDNKKGYYLASRDFEDWEIKILIDAIYNAKFLSSSDSEKLSTKLIKLQSKNSQKIIKSANIPPQNNADNISTKIYIDKLIKAIKTNKKVSFQYIYTDVNLNKKLRRDGNFYIVNPYKLLWSNGYYYLICNYDKYDNLSSYRLDRIKNLSICDSPRKPAESILGKNSEYKILEYTQSTIYNYGGDIINLTLEVYDYMVDELIDYFGSDLKFKPINNKYQVTLNVANSKGLIYWLLQHEQNIKVISPLSVKDALLKTISNILDLYKEDI